MAIAHATPPAAGVHQLTDLGSLFDVEEDRLGPNGEPIDVRFTFTHLAGQRSPVRPVLKRSDAPGGLYVVKAWEELDPDDPEPWLVYGTGSSELEDTDGDVMHKSALETMCSTARPNMTVWLNHTYSLPDSVFGALVEQPVIEYKTALATGETVPEFAVVKICAFVERDNPPAVKSYKMLLPTTWRKALEFGWSVGCMYKNATARQDKRGRLIGADVWEVQSLEWSLVGIPAEQQSWAAAVQKSYRRRKGLAARAFDADHLANTIRHVDDFDVRTQLWLKRTFTPEVIAVLADRGITGIRFDRSAA